MPGKVSITPEGTGQSRGREGHRNHQKSIKYNLGPKITLGIRPFFGIYFDILSKTTSIKWVVFMNFFLKIN